MEDQSNPIHALIMHAFHDGGAKSVRDDVTGEDFSGASGVIAHWDRATCAMRLSFNDRESWESPTRHHIDLTKSDEWEYISDYTITLDGEHWFEAWKEVFGAAFMSPACSPEYRPLNWRRGEDIGKFEGRALIVTTPQVEAGPSGAQTVEISGGMAFGSLGSCPVDRVAFWIPLHTLPPLPGGEG